MMQKTLIIILALALLIADLEASDSPVLHKKVTKELTKLFDAGYDMRELPLQVQGEQQSDLIQEGDQLFAVEGKEGTMGYVLSTSAKGRYDYFDYSIIYSKDLSVKSVLVTTYRSSHGAGICSKGWLKQFIGYQGEEIRIGKDVDSVSGGTISATSMVEDMKRSYQLMEALRITGRIN